MGRGVSTEPSCEIPRLRHPVALEKFYSDYYVPRRPVIIATESLADLGWRTQLWDRDYLLYKAGSQLVQVLRRGDNSNFSPDQSRYVNMPFHVFLDRIMGSKAGDRDLYLNLQRGRIIDPPLLQLLGDFAIPEYFKDLTIGSINLWMGNSVDSITTPLHHDFHDNLYVVVQGRKQFVLFPPQQAENLYTRGKLLGIESNGFIRYESMQNRPHMCGVDPVRPDLGLYPLFAKAQGSRLECSLEKNEMLFLPGCWFHQVTSMGQHIAVSFFAELPGVEQLASLREALARYEGKHASR